MKLPRLIVAILLGVSINMAASTGFAPSGGAIFAQTLDSPMPSFENRYETDHFVLKWTNRSRNSSDNIKDPQIIKETAGYLEAGVDEIYGSLRKKTLRGPWPGQDRGGFSKH